MCSGSNPVFGKFCFVRDTKSKRLIPSNLQIPTENVFEGFTMGDAIRDEIDKGPVEIFRGGKIIGNVTGYKIVRNRLKLVEEYFDPEDVA